METADLIQHLRRFPLFQDVGPAELATLLRSVRQYRAGRDAFLFHEGEPADTLYLLVEGWVKLTQVTAAGQQILLRFAGVGEILGIIGIVGRTTYTVSAEAVEDCLALAVDGETMSDLLERCPRLALNAVKMLAGQVQEMQDRYRELATERVERRIARTLLRLAAQAGRPMPGGILLDVRLSRENLADMTGTTLYTVSRILSRWEQAGLVKSRRERVLIRQPQGLATIAEDRPQEQSPAN